MIKRKERGSYVKGGEIKKNDERKKGKNAHHQGYREEKMEG